MERIQDSAGYLVSPLSGKGPGVLVLHPWWGLNDTIKGVCDRLGKLGFVAYAPDLYHGELATTIADAEKLAHNLDDERAIADTQTAVNRLLESGADPAKGISVIGFSLGAYYALQLSGADPERVRAVVLFYGTGDGDFQKSQATYLAHFAENDPEFNLCSDVALFG